MKTFILSFILVFSAACAGADEAPSPRLEFNSRFDPEVKAAVESIQKSSKPQTHRIDFKMMFDKITAELENAFTFDGVEFFLSKADQATRRLDKKTTHRTLSPRIVSETNLLDKATIDARIECFDILKNSAKKVNGLLEYAVRQTNDPNQINHLRDLQVRFTQLQELIVNARTRFLSYDVVSPAIALAKYKVRKDRDHFTRVREHFNVFSRRVHMDFIYESNEDVRQQFLELLRNAKKNLSVRQWDDIITETTLTDSIDKSKARGGNSWWSK